MHTGVPFFTASRSFFTSFGSVPSPCRKRLQVEGQQRGNMSWGGTT